MRVCKTCKQNKEHNFFMLRENGRAIFKDALGGIWNGRQCYECMREYTKSVAGKEALADIVCANCAREFRQKVNNQRFCSKTCNKLIKL
jgi:hypothetical protein